MGDNLDAARQRMINAADGLPSIEHGTSYGSSSLKVRGKFLSRVKDADTLVVMCPLEEKEMLIAAAPNIYFETDHYKGWPAILVRLSAIVNGGRNPGHWGGVKAGQSGRDRGRSRRALSNCAVASERPQGFGVTVVDQAVLG